MSKSMTQEEYREKRKQLLLKQADAYARFTHAGSPGASLSAEREIADLDRQIRQLDAAHNAQQ